MLKRNFTPFPILATERLTLRQLVTNDEHAIFTLRPDTEINKFLDRKIAGNLNDAGNFTTPWFVSHEPWHRHNIGIYATWARHCNLYALVLHRNPPTPWFVAHKPIPTPLSHAPIARHGS